MAVGMGAEEVAHPFAGAEGQIRLAVQPAEAALKQWHQGGKGNLLGKIELATGPPVLEVHDQGNTQATSQAEGNGTEGEIGNREDRIGPKPPRHGIQAGGTPEGLGKNLEIAEEPGEARAGDPPPPGG